MAFVCTALGTLHFMMSWINVVNGIADPMILTQSCIADDDVMHTEKRPQSLLQVQSTIGQRDQQVNYLDRFLKAKRGKQPTSLLQRILLKAARKDSVEPIPPDNSQEHRSKDTGTSAVVEEMLVVKGDSATTGGHEKLKLVEALAAMSRRSEATTSVSRMAPFAFAVLGLVALCFAALFFYLRSKGFPENEKTQAAAGEELLRQRGSIAATDSRASLQGTGTQSTPMRRSLGTPQTSPQLSIFRGSPLPSRLQPAAREAMQVASPYLCPGLVVPPGYECTLTVPTIPPSAAALEPVSLYTKDLQGNPVIQGDVLATKVAKIGQRPLVVLRSCTGPRLTGEQSSPVLCSSKIGSEAGGQKHVCIFDSRNELFAQVRKDAANRRYFLTNDGLGSRLYFEGDFLSHCVSVLDDQRQSVAETDPSSSTFNLRVKPSTDIGLILCVLYSVEIMESA